MKKIRSYSSEMEAHLSSNLLVAQGLKAEVVGAKEYTAHVLGGGLGRYSLNVPEEDASAAETILLGVENRTASESEDDRNYFGRAVFFALAPALIFPIIFNFASLYSARVFWRRSAKNAAAKYKMALILVLQIPGFLLVGMLVSLFVHR